MTPGKTDASAKIKRLLEISRGVLQDCSVENGAIIAANTDKPYYPREAANYHYVWPRDAAFICVASELLKLGIQEPCFRWLTDRPEDFKKEQLLYGNYATNGRLGTILDFEPDQMGTTLWSIYVHFEHELKHALKFQELLERLANGLVAVWNKTYFTKNTTDLWEESNRQTSTRIENNFTYTLAACSRGLMCANEILPHHLWKETALQMLSEIDEAYDESRGYFLRNKGKLADPNVDASLLGLVYPFNVIEPDDKRMMSTVRKMEEAIVSDGGVHRYQYDYYDGEGSAWEGGGVWPLLNFWMAIYWQRLGDEEKAWTYYRWVLDRVEDYIPEQIFPDFRRGIYPFAWAHAMFVLATKELGLWPKS